MCGHREGFELVLEVFHDVALVAVGHHADQAAGHPDLAVLEHRDQAADAVLLLDPAPQGDDLEAVLLLLLLALDVLDVSLQAVLFIANGGGPVAAHQAEQRLGAAGQVEPVADAVDHIVVAVGALADDPHRCEVAARLALARGGVDQDDLGAGGRRAGPVVQPLFLELATADRARALLVERRPGAWLALGDLDHLRREPLRPQWLARAPAQWVVLLRLHGQGDDPDALLAAVLLDVGQQSPGQVVLVPTGHDEHQLAAGLHAGHEVVAPPGPLLVADGLAVGVLAALDRVVDDGQICAAACDRTANAGGEVLALLGRVPAAGSRRVGRQAALREDAGVLLAADNISHAAAKPFGQFLGVRRGDDAVRRVAAQVPGGEGHG